jgi:site-specific DNA recombinase
VVKRRFVYIGQRKFDRVSSRTGERKPAKEIVIVNVPAIIEAELFERLQQQLRAAPRLAVPRGTTGPILLSGLAICATYGGSVTLRTGTSRSGAVHRYYTCSTRPEKVRAPAGASPYP